MRYQVKITHEEREVHTEIFTAKTVRSMQLRINKIVASLPDFGGSNRK